MSRTSTSSRCLFFGIIGLGGRRGAGGPSVEVRGVGDEGQSCHSLVNCVALAINVSYFSSVCRSLLFNVCVKYYCISSSTTNGQIQSAKPNTRLLQSIEGLFDSCFEDDNLGSMKSQSLPILTDTVMLAPDSPAVP
jgi:hypothetical protein